MKTEKVRIDGMVDAEVKEMLREMAKADEDRPMIKMLSKIIKEAYRRFKNEN